MEYTSDNLEKAVTLFYRTDAGQQAEAHQWLTEAQNSPQAWGFVWELLSSHRNSEVQFFAATTLHTKLMKHWNEVPEDHYEILKKRILEAIINYAMGPKIVLNRLCITLSAYIIHTVPVHWPNAFEELVSSFQPQHLPNVEPERVIWILLEILTVIPEEFQSTILTLSQRAKVRNVLQEVSKDILKVVEMCLMPLPSAGFDMSNLTTYLNAARCATAWIQLGGLNIDECLPVMNLLVNLTGFTYWNKSDPECLSSEEMELIEINIEALTGIIQHPHTIRYKTLLIKTSADIFYKFEMILEVERANPENNKDVIATLYGFLINIADVHSKMFISNLKSENAAEQKISVDYFSSILKCTDLPGLYPVDESSSTLTFGFWYTLQDEILSLETAECAQLLLMIKPYYRDLVCIMLRKSMFPLNEDNEWTLDDKEVFRCYRQDIADTFMYCYNVLNLEMLDILNAKLAEALRKGPNRTIQWNQVETCLHAFGAIAESIELENLYLPKLMVTIKEIPFNSLHRKVMASALETVGAYSDWITEHPEMLENVLPLVISALDKPEVATSATMALKDLTHSCQKYLVPYADHILVAAQMALQGGNLKLAECSRLMFSTGKVLSILPISRIMEYLNIILAPGFKELQELIVAEPTPAVKTSLVTRLKILSSLFNSLCVKKTTNEDIIQPTVLVMQNTMPIFKVIGKKYSTSTEIMEELSILLKYVISTLMDDSTPLINDILELVVTVYRECPQANILMVAKTALIMFGMQEQFRSIIHQLLHEIVGTTLQMCAQLNSTNQLADKTDVLEGFFSLMGQLYKKIPQLMFSSGIDMAAVFQAAILCLSLPVIDTLKLCTSFLVNFIAQSRDTSQASIVQNYGESLVCRILLNLGNSAPRTTVEVFSDLLLALNKKYCDNLSRWLNALLVQENFPSPRITRQQKENFIRIVLREKSNKRRICDAVLEFNLICKGILREDASLP